MTKVFVAEIVETHAGLENVACSFPFLAASPTGDGHGEAIRVTLDQCILTAQVTVARCKAHHTGEVFPGGTKQACPARETR